MILSAGYPPGLGTTRLCLSHSSQAGAPYLGPRVKVITQQAALRRGPERDSERRSMEPERRLEGVCLMRTRCLHGARTACCLLDPGMLILTLVLPRETEVS